MAEQIRFAAIAAHPASDEVDRLDAYIAGGSLTDSALAIGGSGRSRRFATVSVVRIPDPADEMRLALRHSLVCDAARACCARTGGMK